MVTNAAMMSPIMQVSTNSGRTALLIRTPGWSDPVIAVNKAKAKNTNPGSPASLPISPRAHLPPAINHSRGVCPLSLAGWQLPVAWATLALQQTGPAIDPVRIQYAYGASGTILGSLCGYECIRSYGG